MATPSLALDRGLLPRLARAMTASLGLGDMLAAASRAAADLAPQTFTLIWLVQDDRLVLRAAAGTLETVQSALPTSFSFGEGLPGMVARSRQLQVVDHPGQDPRASQQDLLLAERVRWFVGVPLSGRYALQGVLGVFGRAEPLEGEPLEALGALADQVALAVEGARLDADSERRRRHAEALAAVSQALAHSLDPRQVSQLIADSVITLLGARDAVLFRLEPETGALVSLAFAGLHGESDAPLVMPRGVGLGGGAVLEQRLLTTREALADPAITYTPEVRERLRRLDVHAAMAAPLLVNGDAIGVLGIAAGPGLVFDDEARGLVEAFADQASVALNTARLFAAERSARADAEAAGRRFRGLVESIDAVVTEFEVPARRALFVSRRAESLLGYPVERWTAEPDFWAARVHPDDRERVLAYTSDETAAGRDHVQEYRMLAADGRAVWVRDSANLVQEPGQPARLRCLSVDITERKRTEALLAGEKLLLEMIAAGESLKGVLDALCRTVEAQGDDGILCSVLLMEGERLHLGAAPSLPRAYVETIDGLAIGPAAGSCGTAAYHRRPVIVEDIARDPLWERHRFLALRHGLRACWSVPVLDVAGAPLATFATYYRTPRRPGDADWRLIERAARLAGIAIERVRAEEALRASELRYRTLVTNIPDVAWLVDRDGTTVFVSPNVEKVSGYTADEICRSGPPAWFGRIHPDDLPEVRRQFDALFEGGGRTFDLEYRMRHKNGRWIWLHDRAVATYEGHGTTYVYGLYSDITDRKHAEEIRALLLNQVITVQEEERRRIARELHDETAQSLASLLLGLSALGEARTVKAARAQARELQQVATRALAEVRRLAWGLRPSVLDDLGLTAALERYAADFGRTRGIAVELEVAGLEGGRMPAAVETALYRIMQEALSNVARHAEAHRVRVRVQRGAAAVTMVVEDDGRGFDLLQPPAPPTAARGLGIHTMRERAAVLRGAVSIASAPASGTRVAVDIPLNAEPA
jgi:PAS domain S-box-containing protein